VMMLINHTTESMIHFIILIDPMMIEVNIQMVNVTWVLNLGPVKFQFNGWLCVLFII